MSFGSIRHRLILFDNDGTLNTQFSCWRYIQQPLGLFEPQGRQLLEDHLKGKMDYEEFSRRTVAMWKGIKIDEILKIIDKIPLRDGALEALNYFRKHGYKVCTVSSGFDIWKWVFRDKYGFVFDDFLANHLVVDDDGLLTGEVEMYVTEDTPKKNKGAHLVNLADKYGINQNETIMVGDGMGDINAFKVVGISFAICPSNKEVAEAADILLNSDSLRSLLDFFNNGVFNGKYKFR